MSGSQFDLQQPATVTLPIGAWNTVLGLIAKGPWDMADPLINAIRSQIQQANVSKLRAVPDQALGE